MHCIIMEVKEEKKNRNTFTLAIFLAAVHILRCDYVRVCKAEINAETVSGEEFFSLRSIKRDIAPSVETDV